MRSETTMMAEQCRLQEWAAQIRDCQSRPADMSIVSWCACHGITKANYYYRLRRVRKACLETSRNFYNTGNRKTEPRSQDWIFP